MKVDPKQSIWSGAQAEDGLVEISDPTRLVKDPLVSVLMITYNHADYLAEAIEGVVSQQCDFPFELIIGEDASSDTTRSIALGYQMKYPELIRLVYSTRNVGMKENGLRILSRARGEFLSYCEGDDFWCSIHKIASQIALIRSDETIGAVHTDWVRCRKVKARWVVGWGDSVHRRVPRRFLEGDIFHTFHYPTILRICTLLVRASAVRACEASPLRKKEYPFCDTVYSVFITSKWRIAYLPATTAVYRLSPGSVLRSGSKARVAYLRSCLEFDTDARDFFSERSDYPKAFRWEQAVGLSLWAIKALDMAAFLSAMKDIWVHFGFFGFFTTGAKALLMRCPSLRRQPRAASGASAAPTRNVRQK